MIALGVRVFLFTFDLPKDPSWLTTVRATTPRSFEGSSVQLCIDTGIATEHVDIFFILFSNCLSRIFFCRQGEICVHLVETMRCSLKLAGLIRKESVFDGEVKSISPIPAN